MKDIGKNKFVRLGLIMILVLALAVGCLPDRTGKEREDGETATGGTASKPETEEGADTTTGNSNDMKQTLTEAASVPVETMKLANSTIAERVYTYGYLQTSDTYVVTPFGNGVVDDIAVSTGDYVEVGDLLYQLEGEDLELSEERDMLAQNSSVTNAKNNKDSLEVTLAQRESDVDSILLSLNTAKDTYEDTLVLYESAIVSKSELDGAKSSMDQTQISYDQALLNLESTRLSYEAAKSSYNESLQNYQLTEKDYVDREGDLFVTAPISGLVTDVGVQKDMMNSGNLGVTIVDDSLMVLNIDIMEKYIYDIDKGQSVDLVLEYEDKTITGTVTDISLTGQNGYYPVEITIENSDKSLVAGMFVEGYINTNIKTNVLKVEKTVLVQDINGNNYIYTIDSDNGKAVKVPVETGIEEGSYVEITGQIKAGDQIVVIGQDYIADEQLITVVNN